MQQWFDNNTKQNKNGVSAGPESLRKFWTEKAGLEKLQPETPEMKATLRIASKETPNARSIRKKPRIDCQTDFKILKLIIFRTASSTTSLACTSPQCTEAAI